MEKTTELGVCYYPEHWPEAGWGEDAARMRALGITIVRIGEFAWSRLEPTRGDYQFDWLLRAMDILHGAGLKIVLGTPTATPPKWLVDEMPDMLPVGRDGQVRGFGSRRHYCFSHEGYGRECDRIVTQMAERFGKHPGLIAWQTDNEYDCHNTTLSWSSASREGFQAWLAKKYKSIKTLNERWGNVFWSMEYGSFDEIELPEQAVTETNPAHRMDFRRYSSDCVVAFNRRQVNIIRKHSPDRDVLHNFMGRTVSFDHFDVGADLDIATWDSYPLGFLEDRSDRPEAFKQKYAKAGDPDNQALHHDLYRSVCRGRWWVMEQQPGPVNWAPHNPAPHDGMVRVWTWEAIAHGAEVVSYFRWRQAPFAQEQMHAGLLRPDGSKAEGFHEAAEVARELEKLAEHGPFEKVSADVAIVFDFHSAWAWDIQPQGKEFDYFRLVSDFYKSLRGLGLTVDFVDPGAHDFSKYSMVLVPGLFAWTDPLREALQRFSGKVLIGPRSGSKTEDFSIPSSLPPDFEGALGGIHVSRVESLRPGLEIAAGAGEIKFWREHLLLEDESSTKITASDGLPFMVGKGQFHYLAGWPNEALMDEVLEGLSTQAGITVMHLPEHVRTVRRGKARFFTNYGAEEFDISTLSLPGKYILGSHVLFPHDVAILMED